MGVLLPRTGAPIMMGALTAGRVALRELESSPGSYKPSSRADSLELACMAPEAWAAPTELPAYEGLQCHRPVSPTGAITTGRLYRYTIRSKNSSRRYSINTMRTALRNGPLIISQI